MKSNRKLLCIITNILKNKKCPRCESRDLTKDKYLNICFSCRNEWYDKEYFSSLQKNIICIKDEVKG